MIEARNCTKYTTKYNLEQQNLDLIVSTHTHTQPRHPTFLRPHFRLTPVPGEENLEMKELSKTSSIEKLDAKVAVEIEDDGIENEQPTDRNREHHSDYQPMRTPSQPALSKKLKALVVALMAKKKGWATTADSTNTSNYNNVTNSQTKIPSYNCRKCLYTPNTTHVNTMARRAEAKLDNLEAMINENALKLLQQKEFVFKQSHSLQLDQLCKTTKFTRRELKWLYSGWKVACTDGCGVSTDSLGGGESYGSHSLSSAYYGIINENQFQQIYAQFFPYGGDCSFYAKYVFQAMFGDTLIKNGGFITFGDYAHALSNLLRGSIEDKISFVFRLYDLNGDNIITLDELSRIFFAVYRLLGDNVNQKHDHMTYEAQAEKLYNKIDLKQTGAITKEQFMEYCIKDSTIVDTIRMLEMSICSSAA